MMSKNVISPPSFYGFINKILDFFFTSSSSLIHLLHDFFQTIITILLPHTITIPFRVTCTSLELEVLPENSKSPELEVSPEPEFHDGVSILFIFGIRLLSHLKEIMKKMN
ncbi:hypothetical protein HanRHA438_Chr06g0287251 [Helianthus annuus]|uniref:Uncharacterized protein n=1 Tax=Helianthus annuus TaxID=4232 RepID=A0A251UK07_HELAN|nr:hypothetical protein HanXRQr2_Chr06g0278011 [Helianthus annuus]KAJ0561887.1 hypothetical protein HanHA300_Chr06g0228121 [Helianthus annuus]KAJ0574953.1 hypothetical protein HanHA89_Chr06g0244081 [Helianthus annuus]KAJ0739283.1 hypothetical protein HanLR1_Chr06g0228131 [Helianthus annuus]KAJ0913584.1 hypothetical protein HanRHA438_Chr06g0287251 [Helianthus annuus]